MSPLIDVARISTCGPSPSDGASSISSSDVVSPLIVLTSMKTCEPCDADLVVARRGLERDVSLTHAAHVDVAGRRLHLQAAAASSIEMSPEAARTLPSPARRPTSRSPEAVFTLAPRRPARA